MGALLAAGAAFSLVDAGPHYLDVLGVAGDGLMLALAIRLHRRAGPLARRPWVPLVRLTGVLLLHVNPFVGAFTVLMAAAVPYARAHTHGDFDVSSTPVLKEPPWPAPRGYRGPRCHSGITPCG